MCGIVAGVAAQDVSGVLVEGLRRLEYRGYDSCGVALNIDGALVRARSTARVAELSEQLAQGKLVGQVGIAHTRWATHGAPATHNAHPHFSAGPQKRASGAPGRIGLVHNGIIENYEELRAALISKGYVFESQTDTEVIAHLIDSLYNGDLLVAVQEAVGALVGAYALAVMCVDEPNRVIGARLGSPLVVGVAASGHYLASDPLALAGTTDQIIYLEDGDVADVQRGTVYLSRKATSGRYEAVTRATKTVAAHSGVAELGPYRHFMQKEIFEQPRALADTLEGVEAISADLFGDKAHRIFKEVDSVLILACGTSYYAGMTAKYWIESIAKLPCNVEIASEYRYRDSVPNPRALVVTITQSGETADTLAALKHAQSLGHDKTLTICNVATSAMVRECALAYITRAGVEIGVASTKAFTTQLAALYLLTLALAQLHGAMSEEETHAELKALRHLPTALASVLALEPQIIAFAERFVKRENALFLGRGVHYPIALEGALKLKEISYIHAEAYPAGELKHGPLALVTDQMPVVVIAPDDSLLGKLKSNMEEVRARGGELFVFTDAASSAVTGHGINVVRLPEHYGRLSPILHTVPLQLLAYHTAVARGTDVDKPRNLAKSVTVE